MERTQAHFPLLETTVRLLRMMKFWNHAPGQPFPVYSLLCIGTYLVMWIVPSWVFILSSQDNVTLLLKAFAEQIVFFTILYKFSSFLYNFRSWERIFYEVQRAFDSVQSDPHPEVQTILKRTRSVSHYLTRRYCSILLFDCTVYGPAAMMFIAVKYFVTGSYSVPLPTPIQADYSFFVPGYQSVFWIWLPFNTLLNATLMVHGLILFLMECFIWNTIYNVACLFRILCIKAGQLGSTEDHQWSTEIDNFVSLHVCALQCAVELEKTLAGQMLFLYLSTIFSLCLPVTVISTAFKDPFLLLTMVMVVLYCMFQSFCFSILGTELIDESEAVANAIFHGGWYNRQIRQQRDMSIIMVRAQRPVKLTAAKLFIVTRVSFTQVLKQAYTIFTLMSQFLGDVVD